MKRLEKVDDTDEKGETCTTLKSHGQRASFKPSVSSPEWSGTCVPCPVECADKPLTEVFTAGTNDTGCRWYDGTMHV